MAANLIPGIKADGIKQSQLKPVLKKIHRNWDMYLIILPVFIFFTIFHYFPMVGIQIAFKNFLATKGIWGSQWVGFFHFKRLFNSYFFWRLITNTLGISIYQLAVSFPANILLALMLNELRSKSFKKTVQFVTYAPHFLSTVVVVGMVLSFLSPNGGLINQVLGLFGIDPVYFMAKPEMFKTIYVFSGVWQNAGWGSIIYLAALAGIDQQLYEAAIVDGASKLKRIWYITIPCLMPTAIIILILDIGKLMNVGFQKVFLMQNNMNIEASDVISTYMYTSGILGSQFSFTTAVGLFNSVINFILLISVNKLSRAVSETSLW